MTQDELRHWIQVQLDTITERDAPGYLNVEEACGWVSGFSKAMERVLEKMRQLER